MPTLMREWPWPQDHTTSTTTTTTNSAPTTTATPSNSAVWDAWPVGPAVFAETSVTARRAAGDSLGDTDTGRDWSARVDAAVHGINDLDPAGLDEWMNIHATSPTPEIYEARLVAAWETHTNTSALDKNTADASHADSGDGGSDGGSPAARVGSAAPGPVFTVVCPPCDLEFVTVPDRAEASHYAGTHNDVHHGGRDEAVTTDIRELDDVAGDSLAADPWAREPQDLSVEDIDEDIDEDGDGDGW